MKTLNQSGDVGERRKVPQSTRLEHLARVFAMGIAAVMLILWASPPTALVAGIIFAVSIGHPFSHWNHKITTWLLQACVVLLGFGMDLPSVLRLGIHGSLFAAITIGATLFLGYWLGNKCSLNRNASTLIAVGTAICGGSAIAAVSTVIGATEVEIAVSIGTIFLLNAIALYIFPVVGHLLHLSQENFGLWAGIAIHDISSVVGAGIIYGHQSLLTAVSVKLSRTLWIVPVTLGIALSQREWPMSGKRDASTPINKAKVSVPWFIGLFILASLLRTQFPAIADLSPNILEVAHRGMILVLFLIGTSLSFRNLRALSWRTIVVGLILWIFISATSLLVICGSMFFRMSI